MGDVDFSGWATVFADGSYCHRTGAWGWAAWTKCRDRTMRISNGGTSGAESAAHVEMMAAYHGIVLAVDSFDPKVVHLVTDCKVVIDGLFGRCALKGRMLDGKKVIWKKVGSRTLRAKHVKAHTRGTKPRDHVNRWCDEEARRQMRAYKKLLRESERWST